MAELAGLGRVDPGSRMGHCLCAGMRSEIIPRALLALGGEHTWEVDPAWDEGVEAGEGGLEI